MSDALNVNSTIGLKLDVYKSDAMIRNSSGAMITSNGSPLSNDSDSTGPSLLAQVERTWLDHGVCFTDRDGAVLQSSGSLLRWLGIQENQFIGQNWVAVLADYFPNVTRSLQSLQSSSAELPVLEFELIDHNGRSRGIVRIERSHYDALVHYRWASAADSSQSRIDNGLDPETCGVVRELSLRLAKSESQMASLASRWPGVLMNQRADLSCFYISPNVEALTGVSAESWLIDCKCYWQVVHPGDTEELRRQILESQTSCSKEGVTTTFRVRNQVSGKVSYVTEHRVAHLSSHGLVLGYEVMWLDMTRQTIAEKRLSSAAWKETLGVVTMGLAHDFSNILSGIHSLSDSFLAQTTEEHPFREGLGLIRSNAYQASQLVHRITQLHHGKTGQLDYHDLNFVSGELSDLIKKIIPRRLTFKTQLNSSPLALYVDAVELRQVILNLVINAIDAIPSNGTITMRTYTAATPPGNVNFRGEFPRSSAAILEVEDTGVGIPDPVLDSIFDPFFTTKSTNKGSGLGLYNAQLFVIKCHGAIAVQTKLGVGTKFSIWLPISNLDEVCHVSPSILEHPQARPRIVVLSQNLAQAEDTLELLRSNCFEAHWVSSPIEPESTNLWSEKPPAGYLIIVDPQTSDLVSWIQSIRSKSDATFVALRFLGCQPDDVDSLCIQDADVIFHLDLMEGEIVEALRKLCG